MAIFVRDTLVKSRLFDKLTVESIRSQTALLMKPAKPYLQDDIYDHLVDLICLLYINKAVPVMEN